MLKFNSASDIDALGFDLVIESTTSLVRNARGKYVILPPDTQSNGQASVSLGTGTTQDDSAIECKETYLMRFDRQAVERGQSGLQSLPIWQIRKVLEYTIDDVVYTEFLYPSGLNGYMFKASKYKEYTYTYGKETNHTLMQ